VKKNSPHDNVLEPRTKANNLVQFQLVYLISYFFAKIIITLAVVMAEPENLIKLSPVVARNARE
jgi:hypothetical protein